MEADEESSFATADGVAVGTIDYMSPEQACGRDVDPRSDLFSLGCTMYHLLSGRLPFPGNSPVERLGVRITGRHVPILDVRPDVPPRLVKVLDMLMANKPSDRYQSAAEAADALEGLLVKKRSSTAIGPPGTSAVRESPHEPPPPPPPPQIRYVEVQPSYPSWFQPLADLAMKSGLLALVVLFVLLLIAFGLGVVAGLAF